MSVLPENEQVIKLNHDDAEEEGWVDTHHGIGQFNSDIILQCLSLITYSYQTCPTRAMGYVGYQNLKNYYNFSLALVLKQNFHCHV